MPAALLQDPGNHTLACWVQAMLDSCGLDELPDGITTREQLCDLAEAKAFDTDRRQFEEPYTNRLSAAFAKYARDAAQTCLDTGGDYSSVERVFGTLADELSRYYRALYREVAEHFHRRAVRNIVNDLKADPWAEEDPFDNQEYDTWYKKTVAEKITKIDAATKARIKLAMDAALRDGTSIPNLARLLRDSYAFSKSRATVIARTEIIGASNSATFFGVGSHINTTNVVRTWIATFDSRTRHTHSYGGGAGGQERSWNEPYNVGGYRMMFPGDTSLGAAAKEIIQCRCTEGYKRKDTGAIR